MCPSLFDCGRRPLSWRNPRMPGSCWAEPWSVAQLVWRYTWHLLSYQLLIKHKRISNRFCTSSLAVARPGPVGDVRERPSCLEQSQREHPHRSPHLDHCCQVGGGQRQHSDGGQDHRPSHHFSPSQWCGDQQRAVDTGVLLQPVAFSPIIEGECKFPEATRKKHHFIKANLKNDSSIHLNCEFHLMFEWIAPYWRWT